jgi:hypothetical protein
MPDVTPNAENRRPLTPMEKARAAAARMRPAHDTGTGTDTASPAPDTGATGHRDVAVAAGSQSGAPTGGDRVGTPGATSGTGTVAGTGATSGTGTVSGADTVSGAGTGGVPGSGGADDGVRTGGSLGAASAGPGAGETGPGGRGAAHTAHEALEGEGHGTPLLPRDECDQLESRLQHAVVGFVDGPRDAVEEADHVLEELAARFTDAVNQRRRTLRGSWQLAESGAKGRQKAATADTEQLRLALRDYRELTERLLHV